MKRKGPRGAGEWERIDWTEAFDMVESNMRRVIDKYGASAFLVAQGTGRGSNHFHFRFDGTYGSGAFTLAPTHVCLMPNLLPTLYTFGFYSFIDAADLLHCNCSVMWGINTLAAWAGIAGRQTLEAKRNGAKLIVIDTRFTELASKADLWLQPKPGSDLALALAFTNVIVNEKLFDEEFCHKWTYGFEELCESVKEYTPEWAEGVSWVPAEKIYAVARMMGQNRPTNVTTSLGVSIHENGMQTGRAVSNLMAILGDLDAKGGNLSNAHWDIMLAPEITLAGPDVLPRINKLPGVAEKPMIGLAGIAWPHAVWESMKEGDNAKTPVKGIICVASDLPMCYEDSAEVTDALSHLDFICVKDYFPNSMTDMADLILPSCHWSEREGQHDEEILSDPCPWVLPQKCVDAPGECIDDWEFFLEMGKRFDPELWPWENTREMHQWRLKTFFDEERSWDELKEDPYLITFGGDKRVYRKYALGQERPDGKPGFRTDSGYIDLWNNFYAQFGYDPLPKWIEPSTYSNEAMIEDYPLFLQTGGRIFPFYHSAWTNIPMQREISPDPFIEMHPDTAKARGIADGEIVKIKAPGNREIKLKAILTKGIDPRVVHIPRPGWKDACKELGLKGYGSTGANPNILVTATPSDGQYGTPPLRSWRCEIEKMEA
jgi:anaerobic selenocysteine-containing dehydrogenase